MWLSSLWSWMMVHLTATAKCFCFCCVGNYPKIKSSIWFTCLEINSKQMVQQTNGSTI